MNDLIKLPNIGPVVAKQLNQVGIDSYEQLKKRGSKQTWLDIQHIDTSACIHRLYAFEAAIRFIKKQKIYGGGETLFPAGKTHEISISAM